MNTQADLSSDEANRLKAQPPLKDKSQGNWFAILTVAITAFALVTSEFLPVGVLNAIATELKV